MEAVKEGTTGEYSLRDGKRIFCPKMTPEMIEHNMRIKMVTLGQSRSRVCG